MIKFVKVLWEKLTGKPQPKAILLMGMPGAGKGTQAFRIVKALPNSVHFDTGGEIYRRVTDPDYQNDPLVKEQKEVYFAGRLNEPKWVSELVAERIRTYAAEGESLVFSGSPRTLYEAKALKPILFKEYGRKNVLMVALNIDLETAKQRSLNRLVCANKTCRFPTTKDQAGKPCPNCGKPLPTGEQEDEEWKINLLSTRVAEYLTRTIPAMKYLSGFRITKEINGEKSEEEISRQILNKIKLM